MSAFAKVLEFFGLKASSTVLDVTPEPIHEDPTNRGTPGSQERGAAPRRSSTPAVDGFSPAPSAAANDAIERERRERERLEQRLRESEEERRRLALERGAAVAQGSNAASSPNSGSDSERQEPPTDAAPGSVTGNDHRAGQPAPAPEDDRTRNPFTERTAGKVPTGVIVLTAGPNVGLVRALSAGRNVVGRHLAGTKITVPLRDDQQVISREHCEIECTGDRFTISPLKTSIGELAVTVVNDNPLERKTVLRDGATIRIFDNVLRFRSLEGAS